MDPIENRLVEMLPRKDRVRLQAICEPVQLKSNEILYEPRAPTRYVYFPVQSVIALVSAIDDGSRLEVGMVGHEGLVGTQLLAGVLTSPLRALVHNSGLAWRIESVAFRTELARSAALQRVLGRYLCVLLGQLATAATCLRFHVLGPRLARRLLMIQDRSHADHFHVTQEVLADMLGVRRVGITVAAGELLRSGLIAYRRGEVRVLDRTRLEVAACSCYRADQRLYSEVMR